MQASAYISESQANMLGFCIGPGLRGRLRCADQLTRHVPFNILLRGPLQRIFDGVAFFETGQNSKPRAQFVSTFSRLHDRYYVLKIATFVTPPNSVKNWKTRIVIPVEAVNPIFRLVADSDARDN